ncbi:MAG: DUF1573 domain-containing protein [Planctomycetota bacterium]
MPGLSGSEPEEPHLVCRNPEVDLGSVTAGQALEHTFVLENRGKSAITISRIEVTCDFANPRLFGRGGEVAIDASGTTTHELATGEKARLRLGIATGSLEGNLRRKLLVHSNDPFQAVLPLTFALKVTPAKSEPKVEATPAPGSTSSSGTAEPTHPQPPSQVIPSGPQPKLEADVAEVDFGDVLTEEKVKKTFTLTNTGEAELQIKQVDKSCGCTVPVMRVNDQEVSVAELNSGQKTVKLAPRETAQMEIEFDAKGQPPGKFRRAVTIHSNDPSRERLAIDVKATVVRAFELNPTNLRFKPIKRHHAETASLVFKSSLLSDIELVEAKTPSPFVSVTWNKVPQADPKSVEIRIDVTITSEAPVGLIQNPIVIKTSSERVKEFMIPILAKVDPEVTFTIEGSSNAPKIDFGIITEPSPLARDVLIVNENPAIPYSIDSVKIESKNAADLKAEVITEEPGIRYRLRITALQSLTARYFRGVVRLYSRHPDLPMKEIPFQGWVSR